MKKIILLAFILVTLFSKAQESRLTIFSEDGDPFYVVLNGIRQNEKPLVNIAIDYLVNPFYDAKIVFANETIPTIEKKRLMVVDVDNRNGEFTYKIKSTNKGKNLRFFSFTPFQAILPPPSNVALVHYNAVPLPPIQTITQTTTTTSAGNGDQINIGVGVNAGGANIGVGINVNSGVSTTTTQTTTTTIGVPNQVVLLEEPPCFAMSRNDFSQALNSIKSKTFTDARLTMAQQITKSNCLTSEQIGQITTLFDFEETKLQYAKFAFGFCLNPENYWKVNDAFDFESSIDELNRYIESFRY
jgi:hypothetical protein